MKKVVQVVYNMNCGGIEKFIMNMYKEMVHKNIQFDFIYMNNKNVPSYYDKKIKELGGKIYYIGKLNILNLIKFSINFIKIIKKNNYIALHVHSFYNCGLISTLAKIGKQKNIIVHSHTTKDNKTVKNVFRKIYIIISKKLINMNSDIKLACGEEAGKALYGNNKFYIINNGVDTKEFTNIIYSDILKLKKELKIEKENIIVHVGNFFPVKNHKFIVEIAKKLKEKGFKYKILLIGDGPLRNEIQSLVNKNGLNKEVSILGLRNDVYNLLLLSDVFIFPSFYEGFPISLIEAQAAGLPCIISDNIDSKVDLQINKITFLNVANTNAWVKSIINFPNKKELKKSVEKIKKNHMDLQSNSELLYKFYFEESKLEVK